MSLRDSLPVLDARSYGPERAADIAAWCERHPLGYVNVGDWSSGQRAGAPSWLQAQQLARQWWVRSECMRRGIPCRISWGFRYDVLEPPAGRANEIPPTWTARSAQPWLEALRAWTAAGWTWGVAPWLDGRWWAAQPSDAAVYIQVDPVHPELRIVGVLRELRVTGMAAEVAREAKDAAAWLGADALIVGVKPWQRPGAELRLTPSTARGPGSLVQPTPYRRGEWEMGTSLALAAIGAEVPVLTLTRLPQPPLVEILGDATASKAIVAEAALGYLP